MQAGNRNAGIGAGWLCVPTGGTSGGLRFARHDERTLTAAARGFCGHFGLERVNAVDVLPPFHVSGLMARIRCAETGGTHVAWNWRRLEAGERPALGTAGGSWVISLVPTQLQRLLASPEVLEWLRKFAIIFIGGGPIWPELAETAAKAELSLSISYGMTETAAMIAALRPREFLRGERNCGPALPHVRITITADETIWIEGESVFRGYFPELRESRKFESSDLGRMDEHGRLHVLGRRDSAIITGGEKVHPLEVEMVLRATGQFTDIAVIGIPDQQWGGAVVACYPADGPVPDFGIVRQMVDNRLAAFKRPKHYVAVADWPRNSLGKLNRTQLAASVNARGT
jgi:O-succinylbenzoic acid--CoA ligase